MTSSDFLYSYEVQNHSSDILMY